MSFLVHFYEPRIDNNFTTFVWKLSKIYFYSGGVLLLENSTIMINFNMF